MFKVVITGPESVGKSLLAGKLAEIYDGFEVPEYARNYIEQLDREYTYEDVEHIARTQISEFRQYEQLRKEKKKPVFFDTSLIITKVWFLIVYGRMPDWLEEAILELRVDLFLLCYPDIPWKADAVRENGNIREELYEIYKKELENYGFRYIEVRGIGEERICAVKKEIDNFFIH